MRKIELPAGHEVINSDELRTLRRKERSHDAYIWATRAMADKRREVHSLLVGQAGNTTEDERMISYARGYSNALTDFSRLVVEAPIPD